MFAELHCVSNFSFLRGASHPEELIVQADIQGYQALAITDECSVAGVVRAHQAIKDHQLNIKLVVGSEFVCFNEDPQLRHGPIPRTRRTKQSFVLLAPNRKAYAELCQLITRCRRRSDKGEYQFQLEDLWGLEELFILWKPGQYDEQTLQQASELQLYFADRLWLMAERFFEPEDELSYQASLNIAAQLSIPLVAANDVHMHSAERKVMLDALVAIRNNQSIESVRQHLFINAERHLRPPEVLQQIYPQALLNNTLEIASRCTFSLDEIAYQYPQDAMPEGEEKTSYLKKLVDQGKKERFPDGTPDRIEALINKELKTIQELEYEHYFITIFDIVRHARSIGILCQGRGSAANSVVCYCLKITEVNPDEVSLLFERFISKERNEPPDIDVDFESQRREEVIQYIYNKYSRDRAALTATVISYRPKSAIRDVAKALGLDMMQLEKVIANYGWRYRDKKKDNWLDDIISPLLPAHSKASDLNQGRTGNRLLLFKKLVNELLGFPRHLSQHVGGFVISQGLLADLVPIENAAMPDRTVIQWDKDDLESLGLMKVDILSLGMLSAIRRCLGNLSTPNKAFTLADIPREDPATYRMLQKADSIGVFQVESRAQMNMLPRLRPRNYYDLVVQVSIVRPGPIHGDMVHPYLKRRNGIEEVSYPLPELKPILERTFGVPLFQEQVIAFAMVAADFTAGEADQLRRSMASWKRKGHMSELQYRLGQRMAQKGFEPPYIERIQRQLEGFGEYGFPESHAASFALLVYVSSWLKCHHPAEFYCGLLNSQPMGFYTPSQLIQDAVRHKVQVLSADINFSDWEHKVVAKQAQPTLRIGLLQVQGLRQEQAEIIIQHRPEDGYQHLTEIHRLPGLNQNTPELLAAADVFSSLNLHRYQARWLSSEPVQTDLLQDAIDSSQLELNAPSELENMLEDYQSLSLSLGRHPIEFMREQGLLGNSLAADELKQIQHDTEVFVAGLVVGRQRPGTASGVTFVTLEDETGNINVVVWSSTAHKQLKDLVKSKVLQIYGRLEKDESSGLIHIIAYRLIDLSASMDAMEAMSSRLAIGSRDYH